MKFNCEVNKRFLFPFRVTLSNNEFQILTFMSIKFLATKRISSLQALYYKTQKRKRLKYICTDCGNKFLDLVKLNKDKIDYPHCDV